MGPNQTLTLLVLVITFHTTLSHSTSSLALHIHFTKIAGGDFSDRSSSRSSISINGNADGASPSLKSQPNYTYSPGTAPPPDIAVSTTSRNSGSSVSINRNADSPSPSPSGVSTCGCSPAPPPRGPEPSDFPNLQQYFAYFVIQQFKETITCDPRGVTKTWAGYRLCSNETDSDNDKKYYKGFYCASPTNSPANTTVASVDFNGYGLCAPTIANFVDKLPDLALFHANSNNFSGTVPDLRGLQYLYELDLSNNNFSGPFPNNVIPLGGLLFLDLRFNNFVGTVPPPVFDLSVEALFINNNMFNGRIPDNFGSTTAEYLVVANNQFTGPIPRSIYNTSGTLSEVLFLNNNLSGCLPYEIGLVENLTVFDAGTNQVTGPIPLSFGCLSLLEQLNLAQNQLYGHVPDVLCLLAKTGKLENLSLSENYFHSVGLHCMELVETKVLDVRHNCILGFPDQRSALDCAWFYSSHKHCPFIPHIPCNLPGWPFKPPTSAVLPETKMPVTTPDGHTGYKSPPHKGNGN